MSTSTIKAGLDDIARVIRDERQACINSKNRFTISYNNLVAIPTTFATLIAEINALVALDPSERDEADDVYIAERAQLQAEFIALRNLVNTVVQELATYDFEV